MLRHGRVEEIKRYQVNYTKTFNKRNYMLPNKLYVIKPAQREKFEHKTFSINLFFMLYILTIKDIRT